MHLQKFDLSPMATLPVHPSRMIGAQPATTE